MSMDHIYVYDIPSYEVAAEVQRIFFAHGKEWTMSGKSIRCVGPYPAHLVTDYDIVDKITRGDSDDYETDNMKEHDPLLVKIHWSDFLKLEDKEDSSMEIGQHFKLVTKTAEEEYELIEKGIQDVKTEKKGYLAISVDKTEKELKFWSYAQFHVLKQQGVIKEVR